MKGLEHLLYEVKKIVVGQDHFLERVLVALLAGGHLLVEGVPGLAKTLTVATLARAMRGSFKRIQFTPDLVPADLIGTRIYNQKSGEFATVLGPVFANLVLADEINRAPAKVQSALLEVMQERQVTIAGESHPVPSPFVVMATQNPIETEGTYALPEAQVDRFMMKVLVGLSHRGRGIRHRPARHRQPDRDRRRHHHRGTAGDAAGIAARSMSIPRWSPMRSSWWRRRAIRARRACPIMAALSSTARRPRATIGMIEAGRALAFLRGRDYVLPADVVDIAPDVLRHRVVPSYEALAEGITADKLVARHHAGGARAGESAGNPCPLRKRLKRSCARLDLKVARRLEGLLQGDHRSAFRGQGLDLADLREYQYHDDVRHMDWNVTARLQIPHVREYLEDREITAWFLLDMSPSIDFESVSVSKRAVLAEFTALVCRLLAGKGNRTGAMLFSGKRRARDSGARRPPAVAGAARCPDPAPQSKRAGSKAPVDRPHAGAVRRGGPDPPPLAGLHRLRFHHRPGLGKAAGPARQPP